jgi:hypothetical protein
MRLLTAVRNLLLVLFLSIITMGYALATIGTAQDGRFHWSYSGIGDISTATDGCFDVAAGLTAYFKASLGSGAPWSDVHLDFNACAAQATVAHVSGTVPMDFDGTKFNQPVTLVSMPDPLMPTSQGSLAIIWVALWVVTFALGFMGGQQR